MTWRILGPLAGAVAIVAVIDATDAAPQSRRQEGDVRPSTPVSHAVNGWPPTAGPAVSAAARLPPMMVVLSS